jgi:hypothetical protein
VNWLNKMDNKVPTHLCILQRIKTHRIRSDIEHGHGKFGTFNNFHVGRKSSNGRSSNISIPKRWRLLKFTRNLRHASLIMCVLSLAWNTGSTSSKLPVLEKGRAAIWKIAAGPCWRRSRETIAYGPFSSMRIMSDDRDIPRVSVREPIIKSLGL